MGVLHLIEPSTLMGVSAIIATSGLAGLKLWIYLQNSMNIERARTRRMVIALRGASSRDRADIIRACANLEAAADTTARSEVESGVERANALGRLSPRVSRQ